MPVDVAGGRVTADEIIDARRRGDRAADALRGWPDHLRVMADIGPVAAAAVVREDAGNEITLLRRPAADHRLETERASRPHPQILADAAPLRTVRMGEQAGRGHLLRVHRGTH